MPSPYFLFEHATDSAFRDEPSPLVFPWNNQERLSVFIGGEDGGWKDVAARVDASLTASIVWFPDANVAIKPETTPLWDALRAGRLWSGRALVVMTTIVQHELREWLAEPFRNKDRAEAIREALATNGSWLESYGLEREKDTPEFGAALGYIRLLAFRRYLALAGKDGQTMLGADASSKAAALNAVNAKISPRSVRLAKKGLQDDEKHGEVNFNDEIHCLTAIIYALRTGREVVILTADEDFIEVFYKAQWFLDTHYRAWLAAKLVSEGRYGEPIGEWTDTENDFFEGPLLLYRRMTAQLHEVLPPLYTTVRVGVVYVTPHNQIRRVVVRFEREMLGMLETRGLTEGRCTDLFGENNLHVDLGPVSYKYRKTRNPLEGMLLGIGRDLGTRVETDGTFQQLSALDRVHVINCQERRASSTPRK